MVMANIGADCCLLQKYLSTVHKLTSIMQLGFRPRIGNKDSGIPAITKGMA